jgi:hypothetical protein
MTETSLALAGAIMNLTAALKDHPVTRSVAYLDAAIDVVDFNANPNDPQVVRTFEKSAEELLDELAVTRLPDTPEHVAAKRAFEAVLRARVAAR